MGSGYALAEKVSKYGVCTRYDFTVPWHVLWTRIVYVYTGVSREWMEGG